MFVERYVERPRHIEVQVLGDAHGNVVHLGERECSIQRRFQKLIEETPVRPWLDAGAARARSASAAVAAGARRRLRQRRHGGVHRSAPDGGFYFLEMNTRLQVEHPVTELVTGLDLVAQQLRVAAGEPLPLRRRTTSAATATRSSAGCCAEDADAGFVPDDRRVRLLRVPQGPGMRFDGGVTEARR